MCPSLPQEYTNLAEDLRKDGKLGDAAVYYISAAHGWYMRFRHLPREVPQSDSMPPHASPKQLGRFSKDLLSGIACFRLLKESNRARIHGETGLAIITDLLDNEPFFQSGETVRRGVLHEVSGDLQLFGGIESPTAEYNIARERYDGADSPMGWQAEDEFDLPMRLLLEMAEGIDYDIEENQRRKIFRLSLEDRIEFKMDHYEEILQRVLDEGNW